MLLYQITTHVQLKTVPKILKYLILFQVLSQMIKTRVILKRTFLIQILSEKVVHELSHNVYDLDNTLYTFYFEQLNAITLLGK